MSNKVLFGFLVLVAGVLVGWYVLKGNTPFSENRTNKEETNQNVSPTLPVGQDNYDVNSEASLSGESLEKGGVKERRVVTYTDSGFAPDPLTVKIGTTVTFVNESSRGMWVASAVHPTHQLLPGFDQLSSAVKGGTYEYMFVKVGTWKYHNHVNPTDTGSVVVTE